VAAVGNEEGGEVGHADPLAALRAGVTIVRAVRPETARRHAPGRLRGVALAKRILLLVAGRFFGLAKRFLAQIEGFTEEPHHLLNAFDLGHFFGFWGHFLPLPMGAAPTESAPLPPVRRRPGRSGVNRAFSTLDTGHRAESRATDAGRRQQLYPRLFSRTSLWMNVARKCAKSARLPLAACFESLHWACRAARFCFA